MTFHSNPGCLGFLFKLLGQLPANEARLPYHRKDYLLSKAEKSFFGVLNQAVGQEYWLFVKVRVADLLWLPKETESRQSHFNRIQSKHIDFLLCDLENVRPLLAIELDDSSHGSVKRQSRDVFVNEALKAAGFPLLRVAAKAGYSVNELKSQIAVAIGT